MKKFLSIFAQLILISTISVAPVYAQTATLTPTQSGQTPKEMRQEARITAQQQRLDTQTANLQERALKEIQRRVTSLTNLSTKISGFKHISDTQKNTFTTDIQNEITSLNTLLAKIQQDSNITTLRADVQSIVKEYRVYLVFIPQLNIIAAADRMLDITDPSSTTSNLATLESKLQTRISGVNNSSLQNLLTDMQSKIADSKTQANNAISTVIGLTPSQYPATTSSFQSARKMLQTARQDLVSASQDAKTIIQDLKAMNVSPVPTQ